MLDMIHADLIGWEQKLWILNNKRKPLFLVQEHTVQSDKRAYHPWNSEVVKEEAWTLTKFLQDQVLILAKDRPVLYRNLPLATVSVLLCAALPVKVSYKFQARVTIQPKLWLAKTNHRTPWVDSKTMPLRSESSTRCLDQATTRLSKDMWRNTSQLSKLALKQEETSNLKRRKVGRLPQVSMIQVLTGRSWRRLVGRLELKLAEVWLSRDSIKFQEPASILFHLVCLKDPRCICMLRQKRLIQISRRTFLAQANMISSITKVKEIIEPQLTPSVVAAEQI